MMYDFKAARDRIQFLTQMYRLSKRICPDDPDRGNEIAARIEELENEIAEAHAAQNGRMTAVTSSGHPVVHIQNVIVPIITDWSATSNEEVRL